MMGAQTAKWPVEALIRRDRVGRHDPDFCIVLKYETWPLSFCSSIYISLFFFITESVRAASTSSEFLSLLKQLYAPPVSKDSLSCPSEECLYENARGADCAVYRRSAVYFYVAATRPWFIMCSEVENSNFVLYSTLHYFTCNMTWFLKVWFVSGGGELGACVSVHVALCFFQLSWYPFK